MIDEDLFSRMKALHVITSQVTPAFEKALAKKLEAEAVRQGRSDLLRDVPEARLEWSLRDPNKGAPRRAMRPRY